MYFSQTNFSTREDIRLHFSHLDLIIRHKPKRILPGNNHSSLHRNSVVLHRITPFPVHGKSLFGAAPDRSDRRNRLSRTDYEYDLNHSPPFLTPGEPGTLPGAISNRQSQTIPIPIHRQQACSLLFYKLRINGTYLFVPFIYKCYSERIQVESVTTPSSSIYFSQ